MGVINGNSDFPLYNTMDNKDIAVLILCCLMVFAVVSLRFHISGNLKSVLIFLIPFCGFLYVCRGKLNLIVKRLHKFDLGYILLYVLLYYFFAFAAGFLLLHLGFQLKPNAILSVNKDAVFWVMFLIQVFGEELFKLSMFFIVLSLLYKHASKIDNYIIAISALITSLLFAAAHLFAYSSILQPLMILGIGNLVLILAYIQSKNILIPYASHIIVDFIPLMATMFLFIC
ncbi:MAG: CPBP family glutamic-type intramembrane protease [Candidatus Gastranaerophilaceae bacterium]|nr:CPBP family glutamic-type intramembrane protease [Candidatus Gastranaerophilaceae bacterium]